MRLPSRREFLKSSVRVACTAGLSGRALADSLAVNVPSETLLFPPTLSIKKGVWFEMLPAKLSIADRFKMARDAGFEVVQAPTEPDEHKECGPLCITPRSGEQMPFCSSRRW